MRKEFVGAAPRGRLATNMTTTSTSFDLEDGTGYPTGAVGPFVVVIDRGYGHEEKVLCSARSANTFTVQTRGYDGTAAYEHTAPAWVEHVVDSIAVSEMNAHVNDDARDDHSQYLNATRHAAIDAADHGSGTADAGTLLAADGTGGASWVQIVAVPIGAILPYGGGTAPTGWVICDGRALSRTTYADLYAVLGTTYGAGDGSTTFNVPNLQQRFPLGKAATGTGSVLGGTGGAIDHGHSISASSGNAGFHDHSASTNVSTALAGAHGHNAASNASTSVSIGNGGGHGHNGSAGNSGYYSMNRSLGNYSSTHSGSHNHTVTVGNIGDHGHTGSGSTSVSTSVGNVGDHSHTASGSTSIGGSGTHSHSVSASAGANNPPFQVVNYIVKV